MSIVCTSLSCSLRNIGTKPLSCGLLKNVMSNESFQPVAYNSNNSKSYETLHDESVESRTVEFSRSRSRDISGAAFDLQYDEDGLVRDDTSNSQDNHVGSYDSHGNISLNSVMQSTVPEPYSNNGKKAPSHLNMPGGNMGQNQKYLSDNLQKTHWSYKNTNSGSDQGMSGINWHARYLHMLVGNNKLSLLQTKPCVFSDCDVLCLKNVKNPKIIIASNFSENNKSSPESKNNPLEQPRTAKEKLKLAVKDYGSTVIVFHVSISLISLGGFYLAVSSGLDVPSLLKTLGVNEDLISGKLTTGASTFVMAYAIHKVFAPARVAVTLAATPFIVRYLRRIGFLKAK